MAKKEMEGFEMRLGSRQEAIFRGAGPADGGRPDSDHRRTDRAGG